MAEKKEHAELRKVIKNWVESEFSNYNLTIFEDDPGNPIGYGVRKIQNQIPDLHAYSISNGIAIIGEAKTKNDIDNEKTKSQLKNYIKYLKDFKNRGYLIYAVDLDSRASIYNLIKNFVKEIHENELLIKIFVIDNIFKHQIEVKYDSR